MDLLACIWLIYIRFVNFCIAIEFEGSHWHVKCLPSKCRCRHKISCICQLFQLIIGIYSVWNYVILQHTYSYCCTQASCTWKQAWEFLSLLHHTNTTKPTILLAMRIMQKKNPINILTKLISYIYIIKFGSLALFSNLKTSSFQAFKIFQPQSKACKIESHWTLLKFKPMLLSSI